MSVYYNVKIQMYGTYEVESGLLDAASRAMGFLEEDVEETELHNASICFTSDAKPSKMKERVHAFLAKNVPVHYVDVIYRYEYEMVPDRFVVWQDGREKDYTGYVEFREDTVR